MKRFPLAKHRKKVARQLVLARLDKGLGLDEVCSQLGNIDFEELLQIEEGQRSPRANILFALLRLYKVSDKDIGLFFFHPGWQLTLAEE